jgi:hypothetical protein
MRDDECGYCRKSLSQYRKFLKEPFCSDDHKRAYCERLNLLAIERLKELDAVLKEKAPHEYLAHFFANDKM